MRILIHGLGILCLLWSSWLIAASIEIIDLRNRPAEEILPIVKPMLDSDGAISGSGFQLIIRTSPGNLAQIQKIIRQLDTAPRQLMISVFQGSQRELDEASRNIRIHYQDKHIHADAGQPGKPSGARIQAGSGGLNVGASIHRTQSYNSDAPIQQLRILEGTAGFIETGQSIPYFSGRVYSHRGHAIVEAGTDYKDLHTGFYVQPRLHDKQVILGISPYRDSLSKRGAAIIDTQAASTTITGPVGQWLEIGGIENQSSSSGSRIGRHYETRERQSSSLWIKADLVN
jgi:hypothetical protein